MSDLKKKFDCSRGIRMLEDDAENALPQPAITDGRLPFEEIVNADSVMQPRLPTERLLDKQEHIDELAKTARHNENHELDPVTVWWSGRRWIVIDGYNRMAAYTRLRTHKFAPLKIERVPVTVLPPCSWREARLRAEEANVKNKLSLTENEKTENAWKTCAIEGLNMSKPEIARRSGVSVATIDRMRAALKKLNESGQVCIPVDQSWADVWAWFKGRDAEHEKPKGTEWERQMATSIIRDLRRKHGKVMFSNPTILDMVFKALGPRMPKRLVLDEWREGAVEWLECDCEHNRMEA